MNVALKSRACVRACLCVRARALACVCVCARARTSARVCVCERARVYMRINEYSYLDDCTVNKISSFHDFCLLYFSPVS